VLPCSDTSVYWNYTWYPSPSGTCITPLPYSPIIATTRSWCQVSADRTGPVSVVRADGDAEESVAKMRSHVLAKLRAAKQIPAEALDAIERSEMSDVVSSPLSLVRGTISRRGVCVAGDSLHPTTPELGQGGCAAGGRRRPGALPRLRLRRRQGRRGRRGAGEVRGGEAVARHPAHHGGLRRRLRPAEQQRRGQVPQGQVPVRSAGQGAGRHGGLRLREAMILRR
jgi:hypothetical protein